jgi:hypothetical protein
VITTRHLRSSTSPLIGYLAGYIISEDDVFDLEFYVGDYLYSYISTRGAGASVSSLPKNWTAV